MYSAGRKLPSRRLISHLPCFSVRFTKAERYRSHFAIALYERNVSMVNFLRFVLEIPNKSKAFVFASTKRCLPSIITIGSGESVSNSCKPLSLEVSRSCHALARNLLSTRRVNAAASSNALKSSDLNLAASIALRLRKAPIRLMCREERWVAELLACKRDGPEL